jgi:betaine lipid synthase
VYLTGKRGNVKALCEAKTIEEQDRIWKESLRSIFVQGSLVQKLVDSPIFLWNALGVGYSIVIRSLCSV